MVQLECHLAQGWADASADAGPPAKPAQEWRLQTPGGDAPSPHVPEKGQGTFHGAWVVGDAGGARPLPAKWRGLAPGHPPVPHHQRPPTGGVCTEGNVDSVYVGAR